MTPKYTKEYVGVRTGRRVTNYVTFQPKKRSVRTEFRLDEDAVDDEAVDTAGLERLPYRDGLYRLYVKPGYSDEAETLLADLFKAARERYPATPSAR